MALATAPNPLVLLPERQLATLRVLRECGWLYKCAAAALRCPEGTIRSRVHRMLEVTGLPDRAELAYHLALLDHA